MLFKQTERCVFQEHLDVHARQVDASAHDDSATEQAESPFAMTGLFDLIPGSDPSPLRIETGTTADET